MGEPNHANVRPILGVSTPLGCNDNRPKPPPLPPKINSRSNYHKRFLVPSYVSRDFKNAWNRLFKEGYETLMFMLSQRINFYPRSLCHP
ncbi:hypothetical protein IFM89_018504 [Coptis chinensis]|uniref:Uncharacterized protein n=1 Tax=Coptis chinensis TaxID=261450 RepID=A0A835IS56_9MAGN|nr:hypothetical protein IFM89_018504 [Coptis chinensis]